MVTIQDKLVNAAINRGIMSINSKPGLCRKVMEYSGGETRTLNFIISDMRGKQPGFTINRGRLANIGQVRKPTVSFIVNKETFMQMCLGKLTPEQAYFYNKMDIHGDDWLRDYNLFKLIFDEFGNVLNGLMKK